MRHLPLILFSTFALCAFSAHAAEEESVEEEAVNASQSYCLEPILRDVNPVLVAEEKKLPELPPEQAKVLANDSGQAFVINPGNTILVTHEAQICSIMLQKMDYEQFKLEMDKHFGKKSPFHPIDQQVEDDGAVTRDYRASIGDNDYFMIVNARPKYEEGRIQGMITIGRYSEDSSAD